MLVLMHQLVKRCIYKDVLGTDGKPTGERVLTNNI
jgi:hypothetical protein